MRQLGCSLHCTCNANVEWRLAVMYRAYISNLECRKVADSGNSKNRNLRVNNNFIVPTLRRGNAGVDAPAARNCVGASVFVGNPVVRNAPALRTEFPRRSVGTMFYTFA